MSELAIDESFHELKENLGLVYPSLVYVVLVFFGVAALLAVGVYALFLGGGWKAAAAFAVLLFSGVVANNIFYYGVFVFTAHMCGRVLGKEKACFGDFVDAVKSNLFDVIAYSILLLAAGFVLIPTIVGGYVISFILFYAPIYLAVRQRGVWDAVKSSYLFARKNLVKTFILYVLYLAASAISVYTLGILFVFAVPYITLLSMHLIEDEDGLREKQEAT